MYNTPPSQHSSGRWMIVVGMLSTVLAGCAQCHFNSAQQRFCKGDKKESKAILLLEYLAFFIHLLTEVAAVEVEAARRCTLLYNRSSNHCIFCTHRYTGSSTCTRSCGGICQCTTQSSVEGESDFLPPILHCLLLLLGSLSPRQLHHHPPH